MKILTSRKKSQHQLHLFSKVDVSSNQIFISTPRVSATFLSFLHEIRNGQKKEKRILSFFFKILSFDLTKHFLFMFAVKCNIIGWNILFSNLTWLQKSISTSPAIPGGIMTIDTVMGITLDFEVKNDFINWKFSTISPKKSVFKANSWQSKEGRGFVWTGPNKAERKIPKIDFEYWRDSRTSGWW